VTAHNDRRTASNIAIAVAAAKNIVNSATVVEIFHHQASSGVDCS
jgi:hypothetical protein